MPDRPQARHNHRSYLAHACLSSSRQIVGEESLILPLIKQAAVTARGKGQTVRRLGCGAEFQARIRSGRTENPLAG
jgi:hypothetical protein